MKTKVDQRFVLALLAIAASALLLAYIVVRFGDKTEILTLVIGIIGGAMLSAPLGFYFGATHQKGPAQPGAPGATIEATATVTASPDPASNPES